MDTDKLKQAVRDVPDFPKKGIIFKDITTLIRNRETFHEVTDILYNKYKYSGITKIACIESRGFIFGAALADRLNVGMILIRKPGKLPYKTITENYELEYGSDALQVHIDAAVPEDTVLIIDDLLATGGTALASIELIKRLGAEIYGCAFVIELTFLNGVEKIGNTPVFTIIKY